MQTKTYSVHESQYSIEKLTKIHGLETQARNIFLEYRNGKPISAEKSEEIIRLINQLERYPGFNLTTIVLRDIRNGLKNRITST